MFLWICSSPSCEFNETAVTGRYCPWCGQDVEAVCDMCLRALALTPECAVSCAAPVERSKR